MKIRHDITREGCTLSGHILETIFDEGEMRGNYKTHCTKDRKFTLRSIICPQLAGMMLCVHGDNESNDNDIVSFTYKSEQEAQQALDYINEFTVEATAKIEWVYVDDNSEDNALILRCKRIILNQVPGNARYPYVCVCEGDEKEFIQGEKYASVGWRYAVPVPTDEKKLREIWMTDAEMEKFNELIK